MPVTKRVKILSPNTTIVISGDTTVSLRDCTLELDAEGNLWMTDTPAEQVPQQDAPQQAEADRITYLTSFPRADPEGNPDARMHDLLRSRGFPVSGNRVTNVVNANLASAMPPAVTPEPEPSLPPPMLIVGALGADRCFPADCTITVENGVLLIMDSGGDCKGAFSSWDYAVYTPALVVVGGHDEAPRNG